VIHILQGQNPARGETNQSIVVQVASRKTVTSARMQMQTDMTFDAVLFTSVRDKYIH